MRGVLSTLRLVPKDRNWSPRPTFDLLDRLLGWLRAAGDYREKVERLAAWRDYLHALPEDGAVAVLAAVIAFAEWFEEASLEAPGAYTVNVERFLEEEHPSYSWRGRSDRGRSGRCIRGGDGRGEGGAPKGCIVSGAGRMKPLKPPLGRLRAWAAATAMED